VRLSSGERDSTGRYETDVPRSAETGAGARCRELIDVAPVVEEDSVRRARPIKGTDSRYRSTEIRACPDFRTGQRSNFRDRYRLRLGKEAGLFHSGL
jgi:hypothetical protein